MRGERKLYIIVVEIIPTMTSLIVASFLTNALYAVLFASSLQFIGLGDPNTVSWGTMLYWAQNNAALQTGQPLWALAPGVCIAALGAAFALLNYAFDEIGNPALRPVRGTSEAVAPGNGGEASMLEVSGLSVDYVLDRADVRAVDDVSFTLDRASSSASSASRAAASPRCCSPSPSCWRRLPRITAGSVTFQGTNLVGLTDGQLSAIRWRDMSVVMQSAMNALNPVKSIGAQFKDAMQAHGKPSREEIASRSAEVLRMVGIDPVHLRSYPHQLSGGMRQRAMIAMALLFTPDLVIMDEPTSALDVVAQRSLMVQIKELQREFGFAVIFVTHDMSLVSHFSDRLMVMYAGQVAEFGVTRRVFDEPLHPYTRGLLEAFPSIRGPRVPLKGIPGSPPDLSVIASGCRFRLRCPLADEKCAHVAPELTDEDGTLVRCLRYGEDSAMTAPCCETEPSCAACATANRTRDDRATAAS